ncbi:MAG: hypothetical protein AAGE86_06545 [Pseudomonadota bacterium]
MLQDDARVAQAVYKPFGKRDIATKDKNGNRVVLFEEVTDPEELAKLDLHPADLHPNADDLIEMGLINEEERHLVRDSEFRAGVFKKPGTNDYKIVFKGTTSRADWVQNLLQGTTSRSDYYSRAKEIGRDAASKVGKDGVGDVKFVGHSLGGGLASAAAHASGAHATTFNAAGLHLFNRKWFNAPSVDAVSVNGDILTSLQSGLSPALPQAVGKTYRLKPPANTKSAAARANFDRWDRLVPIKGAIKYTKAAIARAVDLHGMARVRQSLRQRDGILGDKAVASGCKC